MHAQTNSLTQPAYRKARAKPWRIIVSVRRNIAANLLALVIGLAIVATMLVWLLHPSKQLPTPQVIVGTKDRVYYYHAATKDDAQSLGQALTGIGFLNDRGTIVLLSKGSAGAVVSFVLDSGGWDHPATVYSFEEIGRRIAPTIGGYPIKIHLIDSDRTLHKELTIGRVAAGAKDEIYYFGSATEADAAALGRALRAAGYLTDRGASVVFSKGDGTAISFVLDDGAWNRQEITAGFERLVRQVAGAAGGLPIELRLLNAKMESKREWEVR
jgi:hypothetical protein